MYLDNNKQLVEEDLEMFIKVAMNLFHKQNIDSGAILHISDPGIRSPKLFKAKKFASKALKGKGAQSVIRVTKRMKIGRGH